jgi:hypothetical protein
VRKGLGFGSDPVSCEHIAIDFTPDSEFLSESLRKNAEDNEDKCSILQTILEKGCSELLLIYEFYSSGIACGPGSDTSYFGFSFKELHDDGVSM